MNLFQYINVVYLSTSVFKTLIKAALPVSAITLSLLIGSLQPVSAQKEEVSESQVGPYIQLGIGTGFGTTVDGSLYGHSVSGDGRTVLSGGIGIGYDFGPVRADISVARGWSYLDNVSVSGYKYDVDDNNYAWGVGLGLALDIPTNSKWTPYLHASGGPSWGDDTDDVAWGYGGGIGVTYAASQEVDVYGQVGCNWAPSQTIDSFDADGSGQFGVGAGVRFRL